MFLHHAIDFSEAPASFERPVDLVHLARQTLGDRALEREILDLFVIQSRAVLDHLHRAEETRQRLDLAHTLKGSARAVGAWHVATCAEQCELVAEADPAWSDALAALQTAIDDVCVAIDAIQAMH
jgi:HPt (histidine-containing phosphotransfer) domain-containing protein